MSCSAMLSLCLFASHSTVFHLWPAVPEGNMRVNKTLKRKPTQEGRGNLLFLCVTTTTSWTGSPGWTEEPFSLVLVPPCWVSSFLHSLLFLSGVQKYLNKQHHNRGDRQVGPVKNVCVQVNAGKLECTHLLVAVQQDQNTHVEGATDWQHLLFKPLFSLATVLDDHNEWSGQQRGVSTWDFISSLQKTLKTLKKRRSWLMSVDVKH